jgi:catechol 2,3-dioxygenase-like lactoylglutathione lyase family enzyme
MIGTMSPVLTHFALQVPDLVDAVAFYRDYCGMGIVHERTSEDSGDRVVWLSEPGKEHDMVLVLFAGSAREAQKPRDYSHFGFAMASKGEVDAIAERARSDGRLAWEPTDEPYPVGYYCGVTDPGGNVVEFSYGQPLGPGAPRS